MSTKRKKVDKDAIRRKRAITQDLYLPADEDQAARFEGAKQRARLAAFTGDEEQVAKAKADLEAVKEEISETGLVLTFKAVGRVRFDALILEHPVDEELAEKEKDLPAQERSVFEPSTFWPALLSETVLSDMTADEWREEVFEGTEWNAAELKLLRDTAQAVNTQTRVAELGN